MYCLSTEGTDTLLIYNVSFEPEFSTFGFLEAEDPVSAKGAWMEAMLGDTRLLLYMTGLHGC